MTPLDALVTYQWYAGTDKITGATEATLEITKDMLGKTIYVEVTALDSSVAKSEATAAVAKQTIVLKGVEQLSADSIVLTFDQDATDVVAKEDIIVEAADGTLVLPLNALTLTEDGLGATAKLSIALTDGKDYNVSLGDSTSTFTASIGAVKSVVIKTDKAEVNTKTKIEFALFDAQGIDVTSTQNIDATCNVTVEGDDVTYDVSKASDASITMTTEKATANVTVTYNSGESGAADISATMKVTCVGATQTIGKALYAENPAVNVNSGCAKFYKGVAQTKPVTVEIGESEPDVYFCATDENGDAIAYDSYDADSSNDDVASVNVTVDTGKFAQLTVSGNTKGSANIVIMAEKNGVKTPYTIPVTVTEEGKLASINVTVDKSRITNALEYAYYGTITVSAKDTNGEAIEPDAIATETVNADKKEGLVVKNTYPFASGYDGTQDDDYNLKAAQADRFGFYTNDLIYTAWCAQGGSQNIKVSVSQDDVLKEKTVGVTVEALPATIWSSNKAADQKEAKMTYAVELSSAYMGGTITSTITEGASSTGILYARLAAYAGSKFAGYVRQDDGGNISIGSPVGVVGGAKAAATPAGGLVLTAKNIGTDANSYNWVVVEGKAYQNKIIGVASGEHTATKDVFFEADPLGDAAGKAGNDYTITLKQDGAAGTKGVYEVTLTAEGNITAGEATILDKTITIADGASVDDVAEQVATEFASDENFTVSNDGAKVVFTQNIASTTENILTDVPANSQAAVNGVEWAKAQKTEAVNPGKESVTITNKTISIQMNNVAENMTVAYVKTLWETKASDGIKALFDLSETATAEQTGQDEVTPGLEYEDNSEYDNTEDPSTANAKGTITYTYSPEVTTVADAATEYATFAEGISNPAEMFEITGGTLGASAAELTKNGTSATMVTSPVLATKETTIDAGTITRGVKFGAKYSPSGWLYDADNNILADKDSLGDHREAFEIDAIDNNATNFYVSGDTSKDGRYARTGSYTVEFRYKVNNGTNASATSNLTVKNSLYIPKVTVTKRVVDSLDASSIVEVLKADVDMNNNTSVYDSIDDTGVYKSVDAYGVPTDAETNSDGTKVTVKYVAVEEDGVSVYVPINATFRTE